MTISIITGGQTGVDTGGLRAAKAAGVPFMGLFPKDWKREEPLGKAYDWIREASMCTESDKYDARTREVVRRAQACLVIAPSLTGSPGTALTVKLAKDEGMQLWAFHHVHDRAIWNAEAHAVAYWLKQMQDVYPALTLMIAGPRAGKWKAGEEVALSIVEMVLKNLKALK